MRPEKLGWLAELEGHLQALVEAGWTVEAEQVIDDGREDLQGFTVHLELSHPPNYDLLDPL